MFQRSLTRRVALMAGVASLVAAAPAAADSISFVRDGNVWLTTPDGARQFQVTTSGDYASASQADDGTFIARLNSSETLQRLDRFGTPTATFATPVSDGPTPTATGSSNYFEGPFDPVVSPDGSKVAYQYYWQHYTNNPGGCGGAAGCMGERLESGTAITYPDRMTPWDVFGNLTGWAEPTWADNDTLLRSNAGVPLAENVVVNTIGPGLGDSQLTRWVKEAYTDERRFAAIDRAHSKLVVADEEWDGVDGSFRTVDGLRIYEVANGFNEAPKPCFRVGYKEDNEHTDRAVWSPAGDKLVFELSGELRIMDVPSLAGCTGEPPAGTTEPRTLIANAHHPSWGPADVPTGRPTVTQPPAKGDGGKGMLSGGTLKASAKAGRLAKALKRGVTIRYTAPGKGTLKAQARKGKTVLATGKATAKKAGKATLKLRFTKAGRKTLKRSRTATLKVALVFTPASGAKTSQTLKVTLKR